MRNSAGFTPRSSRPTPWRTCGRARAVRCVAVRRRPDRIRMS